MVQISRVYPSLPRVEQRLFILVVHLRATRSVRQRIDMHKCGLDQKQDPDKRAHCSGPFRMAKKYAQLDSIERNDSKFSFAKGILPIGAERTKLLHPTHVVQTQEADVKAPVRGLRATCKCATGYIRQRRPKMFFGKKNFANRTRTRKVIASPS